MAFLVFYLCRNDHHSGIFVEASYDSFAILYLAFECYSAIEIGERFG